MNDPGEYNAIRLANYGRDASRAYLSFLRAEERLEREINSAIDQGIKPIKIAHDVMGRCVDQEARIDLLSMLIAMANIGKIPQTVVDPFEKGIRAKRI